jgi:hypothetical protein
MLSFIACDSSSQTTNEPGDNITTDINDELQLTMEDFTNQFNDCKEKIDEILSGHELEEMSYSREKMSSYIIKEMSNDSTQEYTREEILNVHNDTDFDYVTDDYIEQLINTELFMADIQAVLESQENIQLFQPFHPGGDSSITYEFTMPEFGYILINARYNSSHVYLKMGLDNDLLDYQELHYNYSSDSYSPKDDLELSFNYFKFLEDKEAVYTNYLGTSAALRYTSIEDNRQFEITYGDQMIEGVHDGYLLNTYNNQTNVRSILKIQGNEIIGEIYDVFDDHGLVYRYDNYDFNDGIKKLQINAATASGWDYVIASEYSNDEIDELTGIFLDDGTKIYDGRLNCTYTPTYAFVGVWLDMAESFELTNDIFSLNQYGMNVVHPKTNIEYLNQIKIDDVETLKNQLQINNLDFFKDDLFNELYNYIDLDIRNDLEGNNQEPIETTGDIDAFLDAIELYNTNLNETPQYQTNTTVTTTILDDEDSVLSENILRNTIDFDLTAKFYRDYTSVGQTNYSYIIDGTKDQLIEFEINHVLASYYILAEDSTTGNFMEAYSDVTGSDLTFDDMLDNVISITQIEDRVFEFNVTSSFLGQAGIDMNTLLEQDGITGLGSQNIIITYSFNEDFSKYEINYTLDNLEYEDYKVQISTYSITEIKAVDVVSPQDLSYLSYALPQSIEQANFDKVSGPGSYGVFEGTSYLRTYHEPGKYRIHIDSKYALPEIIVLDKDLNEIDSSNQSFEATYEGYYYIKLISNNQTTLDINISKVVKPVFYEFDLDSDDGQFEESLNLDGLNIYNINIPSATYDRLFVIEPYLIEDPTENQPFLILDANIDDINYYESCEINNNLKTCYLYLPADYDINLELKGYFNGDIGFNYIYSEIPQGDFDNNHTWDNINQPLELWITDDNPIARVDFTISEAGTYELSTQYYDFAYSYQDAVLYVSDGTQMSFDWGYGISLEPGDYYIEFKSDSSSTILVYIITEIIKE